jgi:hypothetical protein
MLSLAHVMDLLAHELAGLRRCRLSSALVLASAFQRCFFGHLDPSIPLRE